MNIVVIAGAMAFILGALSVKFDKIFKLCLILLIPAAWLFAKIAPQVYSITAAGSGGFITFYTQWFNTITPDQQSAVFVFPAALIVGRLVGWFYKTYIYQEKVETAQQRKERIVSGFIDH